MIDKNREVYEQRKRDRQKRTCPGHWINRGMKLGNKNCYENGFCIRCGGEEPINSGAYQDLKIIKR